MHTETHCICATPKESVVGGSEGRAQHQKGRQTCGTWRWAGVCCDAVIRDAAGYAMIR